MDSNDRRWLFKVLNLLKMFIPGDQALLESQGSLSLSIFIEFDI